MRNETKLTKWTLVFCSLLMIWFFMQDSHADELDDMLAISVTCYVLNYEAGRAESAKWWLGFTRAWLDQNEVMIANAVRVVRDNLDPNASRDDKRAALKACVDMKTDIEYQIPKKSVFD